MFLYHLYDLSRAYLAPWHWAASMSETACSMPPLSLMPSQATMMASAKMLSRLTRLYPKPRFTFEKMKYRGDEVVITEKTIAERPFCRLVHFEKNIRNTDEPKILLIAPLSGNHATLLRDTVNTLLPEADVTITDWLDARDIPLSQGQLSLDDTVTYLMDFIREIGPQTHVVAVCQPAPLALAAVSLMAEDNDLCCPKSLTLIGGPIDTQSVPTILSTLVNEKPLSWFEANCLHFVPAYYRGAGRLVHPGFMQLQGFMAMHPDKHLKAQTRLFENLVRGDSESVQKHDTFYDEYLSVMDIPATFYMQTIERIFKNNDLANGRLTWRGRLVKPECIKNTALLTIEGEQDDISPPGHTLCAHKLCVNIPTSRKKAHLEIGVGHFGSFNGKKWRRNIYPVLRDFIRSI